MQKAILAAEDHNFYEHNGVDVKGIARAFVANKQRRRRRSRAPRR